MPAPSSAFFLGERPTLAPPPHLRSDCVSRGRGARPRGPSSPNAGGRAFHSAAGGDRRRCRGSSGALLAAELQPLDPRRQRDPLPRSCRSSSARSSATPPHALCAVLSLRDVTSLRQGHRIGAAPTVS